MMEDTAKLGMFSYLKMRSERFSDRALISFYGCKIGCRRFLSLVERHSGFLISENLLKQGDVAAICLPNIPSALVAFYAVNNVGAISNTIHPLTPPQGLAEVLKATRSSVIYIMDTLYPKYADILKDSGVKVILCRAGDCLKGFRAGIIKTFASRILLGGGFYRLADCFGEPYYKLREGAEGAVYMHSAGTTGDPKTVVLSDYALNKLTQNMFEVIINDGSDLVADGDSMLMILPLFHIFGLGVCMHTALCAGCRAVLMPYFDAVRANRLLKSEKINFISGIPSMYSKMMKSRGFAGKHLRELKYCFVGGDRLPEDVKNGFDSLVASYGGKAVLSEGYGLSEATVCSVNTADANRAGSIGVAKGDNRFGIFNGKERLGPLETGEICVSGGCLMTEYLDDRQTTARVLFRDVDGVLWLRTGDCGYLDRDGFLFFKDRLKRLIKISGINVFPKEIEDTAKLAGGIRECAAVEARDGRGKRIIRLFVVPEENADTEQIGQASVSEIKNRLLKYNLPSEIVFLDKLPRNSVMKIDYKALQNY